MAMSASAANKLAGELLSEARTEWARLRRFVRYARGKQSLPWLPDHAESEYRDIAKKSASNWLDLVIRATAQGLHVDGYGPSEMPDRAQPVDDAADANDPWSIWQANGMDAHQHSLHRAVLTCGYSSLIVLPGADQGPPWMRPEAATALYARFTDPYDEWPALAVREVVKDRRYELYDDEVRYIIDGSPGGAGSNVTVMPHELGVCPVVQMVAQLDLLGPPMGEVEPVIPIQDRIVDATFNLQMVAKYGAFPQRWIAGADFSKPLTDANGQPLTDSNGNLIFPTIKAYVDYILTATDPDTKFGQFAAADLNQYVEALEAHIRHLAAITQTPPHYLLGSLVNLSAESLAAAESGLQRKIRDKREVLGERYEQAMRLAALAAGNEDAAIDTSAQIHWQDVESRSLAQTADALLKLSQLGVPVQMLLPMIPTWTQQDVDKAIDFIERGGPLEQLTRVLEQSQQQVTDLLPAA